MRIIRYALAASFLAFPLIASAHMSGQSFEQKIGEYYLDAGCDSYEFLPEEKQYCSVALITNGGTANWEIASYDSVAVRIERAEVEPVVDAVVSAEGQTMTFVPPFTFPGGGEYTMTVRFMEGEKELAQGSFPLTVNGNRGIAGWLTRALFFVEIAGFLAICTLLCAAALGHLRATKKKRRS